VASACLLGLRRLLERAPARVAHPVGAGIAALTLLNACLYLVVTRDVGQTASFSVILLACACFFLSWRWLARTALGVVAGYSAAIAWAVPAPPEWAVPLPSFLLALTLGWLVHEMRLRAYRRIGETHLAEARTRPSWSGRRGAPAGEEGLPALESSPRDLVHDPAHPRHPVAAQILGRSGIELVGPHCAVARDQS
jgi:hypothetical protein